MMENTNLEIGITMIKDSIDCLQVTSPANPCIEKLKNTCDYLARCSVRDVDRIGDYFNDGLIIFDRNKKIIYVNKANEEMFGIPREECVGSNASQFAGDSIWIENAVTMEVFAKKKAFSSITVPKRTGKQLLETGIPVFDNQGELQGVVIVDHDVSELVSIRNKLDATKNQLAQTEEIKNIQQQMIHLLSSQTKSGVEYVAESPAMKSVINLANHVAKSNATVLIMGETGTGKEVLADIIQENSDRSEYPYIKVNCAAIPETLIESELFGYERGAFTGADPKGKAGMFELANHGTLLLDEIGEVPLSFQPKLLRAIQSKQFMRVGGVKNITLDIRIIASTNRDLKKLISNSEFREDLYYRINVLPVVVPPLRDRKEDIDILVRHFLGQFNRKYNKNIILEPLVYFNMKKYRWPGNIRELENILERWVVIYDASSVIRWSQVSHFFTDQLASPDQESGSAYKTRTMAEIMDEYQRDVLLWAAAEYKNVREMASALGVDHSTIVKKAKRLGIKLHI